MNDPSKDKASGQQPEALRALEAAAKAGSQKPQNQGTEATAETAPRPASLEHEQKTAAEVLKAGTEGRPQDPKS